MNDLDRMFLTGFIVGVAIGLLIGLLTGIQMHKNEMIEAGVMQYHPETGEVVIVGREE